MTQMVRFLSGVAASCFFGYMGARIVRTPDTEMIAAISGFVGYMGALTVDLMWLVVRRYYYGEQYGKDTCPGCNCQCVPPARR